MHTAYMSAARNTVGIYGLCKQKKMNPDNKAIEHSDGVFRDCGY